MKRIAFFLLLAGCLLPVLSSRAVDLKQSKVTQIVNDVQIISAADNSTKPASVNDIFKMPDILRTGPNSRAELIADDQTITRIGANTVFSFDPATRTINLKQGSLLFHSPKGKGGGTIQTGSATASVLGTTIVVTTTLNGGFKFLVLEGQGEASFLNGLKQHLDAGQMTFILPGGGMSPIIVFRLDDNTKGSQLINGFDKSLPSWDKINDEIQKQLKLINKDKLKDTGLVVGDNANASQVEAIDPSVLQNYFSQLTLFQPIFTGIGYFTIDGFFIAPDSSEEPVTDALFPAWALSVDVDVADAALNPYHTFVNTGPFDVILPGEPEKNPFLQNPFAGFFGRNINITTPNIDMSLFAGMSFFDFLAAQNINIFGSVTLDGTADTDSIYFTAGNQINFTPGSTLTANVGYLYLGSLGPIDFNNAGIANNIGGIQLSSYDSMTLNNGSVNAATFANFFGQGGVHIIGTQITTSLGGVTFYSDPLGLNGTSPISVDNATVSGEFGVTFNSHGNISMSGGSITAPNGDILAYAFGGGSVTVNGGASLSAGNLITVVPEPTVVSTPNPRIVQLNGAAGVTVDGASITASTIILNSGDGILLNNSTLSGNSLNLSAPNTINVGSLASGQNFSGLTSINMSANTINLINVAFGSSTYAYLTTLNGLAPNPNTGASSLPGYLNLISGNTFGGTLITSANQSTYINPGSGPGIYSTATAPSP